jgi:hypothetical protein
MLRYLLCLVSLLLTPTVSSAQDRTANRILTKYRATRPSTKELAMYRLDWSPSYGEALRRAAAESRPVFLVIIHARYGDIASGHC